jgi:hypothetical protein
MLSDTSTCKVPWDSHGNQSKQIKYTLRKWRVLKLIHDLLVPWWWNKMKSSEVISYMNVQFVSIVSETVSVCIIRDCCDEWCNCLLYLSTWYAVRAQCCLSGFDHMGNRGHCQVNSHHSPCCLTCKFQDASCHWCFFETGLQKIEGLSRSTWVAVYYACIYEVVHAACHSSYLWQATWTI